MNYKKIYDSLIDSRKKHTTPSEYHENHHITPRCFGGSDDPENMVKLTAKEHFIAHLLLTKMYEGTDKAKMVYALRMMTVKNIHHGRVYSSRQYELTKKLISLFCRGENHHSFGIPISEKQKAIMKETYKGKGNPMYGKIPWNKGKKMGPHTEETKSKISNSHKGKHKSVEHRKNLSKSLSNKSKSDDHKSKIRETLTGRKIDPAIVQKTADKLRGRKQSLLTCPYCGKQGGTTMHRWHFDNCKFK